MIDTQPILSQFHLANGLTGANNHGHHYLANRKQHVHHKHSQSLDANGPFSQYNADYIAISECFSHSGSKSFMHKQQPQTNVSTHRQVNTCEVDRFANHIPSSSSNLLGSISQLSVFNNSNATGKQQANRPNCESSSRIVLHARSSSNIVLGSKKQYDQQLNHLNNSSTICSPANQKFCLLSDKSTNRHFKVYEKNELANSTSLIDVSLANCLGTNNCNCNCNKNMLFNERNNSNSLNHYQTQSNYQHPHHHLNQKSFLKSNSNSQSNYPQQSMNKYWETSTLNDKFDSLSLNSNNFVNQLNSLNYSNKSSNGSSHRQVVPPRPPKPINLRISNQITSQPDHLNSTLTTNLLNNNSFNESFSNSSFLLPSDEEYSPTSSSKLYGSYYQFQANQSQHQRPPKNSLSSSCSSNASPFCNSSNAQDSVFVYDQNQLNMSNFQAFNHSTSRLINCEDTECDKSPTYLNNFSLNSQSSPKSSNSTYNLPTPPVVNRGLKPRKVLKNNESKLNNRSSISNSNTNLYNQTNNVLIASGLVGSEADEEFYNNNFNEDHLKSMNEASNGYLDLDFASTQDEDENFCSQQSSFKENARQQPLSSSSTTSSVDQIKDTHTVYKTVDFVRTKAFNKLRTNFERHD